MNHVHGVSRQVAQLGLLLLMGVSISADAGFLGFDGDSWKEEVLLHDGNTVIVERSVERGGRHEIGQKPPFKWQRLRFNMPVTGEHVTWEDNFSEDVGSANFLPMLLDVKHGIAYLVTDTMGCYSYGKWGRPNPPYVVFRYKEKQWKRIALQELPAEIKSPNLIFSSPDEEVEKIGKSLISAKIIQEIYARYRQPEYKTILREPMANTGCPVPSDAAARLIAPIINGKPLYYNWWPLATDWLKSKCPGCDQSTVE